MCIMFCFVRVGKSSWPELVGVEGKVAAETIERENPIVSAHIFIGRKHGVLG